MSVSAELVSRQADKYIGQPYEAIDCQQLWENCLADAGIKLNLRGSNAWWRKMDWTGTPEECKKTFGEIPKGACLFILKNDGGEIRVGYRDGRGNASHIGIYTGRGRGAIHASASKGLVCESAFSGKTIPNGGWNRVGLWKKLSYGDRIDELLGSGQPKEEKPMQTMVVTARSGRTVRMRERPNVSSAPLANVPVGTEVQAGEDQGGWREIVYKDATGYMMAEFLAAPEDAAPVGFTKTISTSEYNALCTARDQLEGIVSLLKGIVGVG